MKRSITLLSLSFAIAQLTSCGMNSDGGGGGGGDADITDRCPLDPDKTSPGQCGCGIEEGACSNNNDTDNDGTPDQVDGCPLDSNKIQPGVCGCGNSDLDSDGDNTADCKDGCPDDPNKAEPGLCDCGVSEGTCSSPDPIITASAENAGKGEGKEETFDGDKTSKWLTFKNTGWIQYDFAGNTSKIIRSYSITSANDFPGRDPLDWELLCSNNGQDWTTVDERSNECFDSRAETRSFRVNNSTPYQMYRLNVSVVKNPSLNILQIAEIELLEASVNGAEPGEEGSCGGSYQTIGGVNKNKNQNIDVVSTAGEDDYEIVAIGGSSVAGGADEPIDSSLMKNQGFRLAGVEGEGDRKAEIWIRKNNGTSTQRIITITGNGFHVPWSVTPLDKDKHFFEIDSLEVVKNDSTFDGRDPTIAALKAPSGDKFTFVAMFFDDSVEITNAKGGIILFTAHSFGDGDGFATIMYEPGQELPDTVEGRCYDGGGRQFVSVAFTPI